MACSELALKDAARSFRLASSFWLPKVMLSIISNFSLSNKLFAYKCSQRNRNRQSFTHPLELICPAHEMRTADFAIPT